MASDMAKGARGKRPEKPTLPVASLLARMLEAIKPYRESVVLIGSIGAAIGSIGVATFGLHDYFITRTEVRVLNCRSLAQLQELEGRLELEAGKDLVLSARATALPAFTKEPLKSLTSEQKDQMGEYIKAQTIIKRYEKFEAAVEEARLRLKPGQCEDFVRVNKDR